MPIEPKDITLDWHLAGETLPPDRAREQFAGYDFADFFADGGAWKGQSYPDAEAAMAAAADQYKGADSDGTGVMVLVWTGEKQARCALFGAPPFDGARP